VSRAERWVALIALGVLLALAGCGRQSETPSGGGGAGAASTIELMVPCGQLGPFSEVVKLFEAANPGVKVVFAPENMVPIVTKIVNGKATPDVFLSMGDLEVDMVEKAGLVVEGTRTKYAENSLALMVPKGNPAGVKTIADLAKPAVNAISIADPEKNSVGMHAVEALKAAGIYDKVAGKIFIMAMAADTKDATAQKQVQASIGYYPCAVEVHIEGAAPAEEKKLKLVGHVAPELYKPFWCEGAIIKGAKNPEGGKKLLAFLTTPAAQEVFRKWEFVQEAPASPGA
jgi:molybdenum ABC transporter molybdate-binding protein